MCMGPGIGPEGTSRRFLLRCLRVGGEEAGRTEPADVTIGGGSNSGGGTGAWPTRHGNSETVAAWTARDSKRDVKLPIRQRVRQESTGSCRELLEGKACKTQPFHGLGNASMMTPRHHIVPQDRIQSRRIPGLLRHDRRGRACRPREDGSFLHHNTRGCQWHGGAWRGAESRRSTQWRAM